MLKRLLDRRSTQLALASGGWLFISGCLADLTRDLDRLLVPGALENALTLPYSRVSGLAQFLLQFLTL